MSKWTVNSETKRLELSDGEWIEVKMQLTWAEEQHLGSAGFRNVTVGSDDSERVLKDVDWSAFSEQKILTWVTDWSARDARGKSINITRSNVKNLPPAITVEILAAIDAHIAEQEEEKKVTPIETASARKSS